MDKDKTEENYEDDEYRYIEQSLEDFKVDGDLKKKHLLLEILFQTI